MPSYDFVVFLAAGALTGLVGALLGLGGGVFLVPLLSIGLHVPFRAAVAASLVAVIATSCVTTIVNMKRGLVNVPLAFTLLLFTSLGGLAGGSLAHQISLRALFTLFAATLFAVAVVVTLRANTRNVLDDPSMNVGRLGGRIVEEGRTFSYLMKRLPFALLVSAGAGAISGLLGIGGGVIQVPILNSFCGIPIRVAAATSAYMIGPTAAVSAYAYIARGDMNPSITAAVALGSLSGSACGIWLSKQLNVRSIKGVLAGALLIVAFRLALEAWRM